MQTPESFPPAEQEPFYEPDEEVVIYLDNIFPSGRAVFGKTQATLTITTEENFY